MNLLQILKTLCFAIGYFCATTNAVFDIGDQAGCGIYLLIIV